MEALFLCAVELRSLADFEKFENIASDHLIRCDNVPDVNEMKIIREVKKKGATLVICVISDSIFYKLKEWFNVDKMKQAACLNGMLYILY